MDDSEKDSKNNLKVRAYFFAVNIIHFIDKFPKNDRTLDVIAKQLLRSATSIGANIIEAQAGSSRKDFTNFFSHALKSANETKFWLSLTRDTKKVSVELVSPVLKESAELANMLGSSIITLKGKR